MADNPTLDNGSLTDIVVSADDAGVDGQVQRMKLAYSADGSAVHVQANADGLLVNLGANNDISGTVILGAGTAEVGKLAAGTAAIGKLAANSGVDIGDVDILSVIPGTGATNLGKAEDAAHATGHTGVMTLAVRRDTAVASSGTDGDYEPLQTDATGYLRTAGKVLDATGTAIAFAAPKAITFAPTIGTGASAVLDSLHTTIITFANAATVNNGTGTIVGAGLWDKDDIGDDARLWLFSRSVTGTTAQDQLSISDADMAYCIGWIDFKDWADGAAGRFAVADRTRLPLPYHCTNTGTSIYGILQLVDTTTPTYTAGGLGGFIHVIAD